MTWDAIVIGGGHNGLVAGAYLARAGARTVVLEARSKTGGAAATDAPWPEAPDIKVTRLSYVMSLMPPRIIRDLELERHGYKLYPMGPAYQAWPDGRSLTIYEDAARRNHEQISRFSSKDAEAITRWDAWLEGLAAVLGSLLTQTPPKLGSRRLSDLRDLLRLAWRYRGLDVRSVADVTRLMTMSARDLLDDWFESEQVKASLAINGVIGTWAGPDSPGTAYVMAHHSIGDVGDGHLGSWGFPEGGMGAVSDAIHRSAVSLGATVRTDARVERVLVAGGRAAGVVLAGGEELRAPVVVTAIHPRITFLEQVDRAELPADFVTDIERWKSRSGVVKINLALGELPDFTADPGAEVGEHHTGAIAMALSVDYIEQAFQDAKQGRGATRPFSDGCIPTVFDKTLAPQGVHVMSLFTQWCPHEWSEAPHTEELEAYADRMIDCHAELAPNLKSAILHREVIGPWQMEQEWGLVGGNIFHGEPSVDQLFHMRPAPGTPTTAPRSPGSTRPARPPTAAAGSAASPAGRRSGPSRPTASGPRDAGEPGVTR
jgi:phytoene dehydrogenase-like protein